MATPKRHFIMEQAATFSETLTLTDENGDALPLAQYTANGAMRKWYTSSNCVVFTIHANNDAGTLTLNLTASQTALINPGRYVYDVSIHHIAANTDDRILEGYITVTPAVSGVSPPAPNTTPFPNSAPIT